MIGSGYWSVGITVKYYVNSRGEPGWGATAKYLDDGFAGDDNPAAGIASTEGELRTCTTEGELRTRYFVNGADSETCLTAAIDAVKRDAERLGIRWRDDSGMRPCVWYSHDGEDENFPPPPGWRAMLAAQSERLGWEPAYRAADA